MSETLPSWVKVWREGFAPLMPLKGLEALKTALEADDPRLTQGSTTTPPPLMCVQDWPCEAGCLICFIGWQGNDLTTVGGVEEFFARACFDADRALNEPAACRWLLNYWDDAPRQRVFKEVLEEVSRELTRRGAAQ